jgi:Glycosyl transferases group 1
MSAPDVIVAWLQNDYGQLGRPGEAIAHALVDEGLARKVAYVEPLRPAPGEPTVERSEIRGLDVYRGQGALNACQHELAQAIVGASGLTDPILLNFGVVETNWHFLYEFGPYVETAVCVTHDKIALWDRVADRAAQLRAIRHRVVTGSDVVCGLSHGAIDDLPDSVYVGHGVDEIWNAEGVDAAAEAADLAAIPHPRAMYVGALSMRFDVEAARALARSGVHVVLIGFDPSQAVQELIAGEPNVHHVGQRQVEDTPSYLLHADLGIIPHTDEPFTRTMEPHKAYNYAAAGLRTVTIRTHTAPQLDDLITATESLDAFVAAAHDAIAKGRLTPDEIAAARAITWGSVGARILAAAAERTPVLT